MSCPNCGHERLKLLVPVNGKTHLLGYYCPHCQSIFKDKDKETTIRRLVCAIPRSAITKSSKGNTSGRS